MKWLVICSGLLILGACAQVDLAKKVIAVKGAEVSATILTDAEWVLCRAASVGSVKDRYGTTEERATTYHEFCEGSGKANVIAPE